MVVFTTVAAIASLVLAAVGTVTTIMGQQQAQQAQEAQASYQAAIARNNAILAERSAKDALDRGKERSARHQEALQQLRGASRVASASQGVLVDEGSAGDLEADIAEVGMQETLDIKNAAEREALGFRTQGMNYTGQAELALLKGQGGSSLGSVSTALTGASSIAGKYASYKQQGIIK